MKKFAVFVVGLMAVGQSSQTPKDVLSTVYFDYDSILLSRMANATNRTTDAKEYLELSQKYLKLL